MVYIDQDALPPTFQICDRFAKRYLVEKMLNLLFFSGLFRSVFPEET